MMVRCTDDGEMHRYAGRLQKLAIIVLVPPIFVGTLMPEATQHESYRQRDELRWEGKYMYKPPFLILVQYLYVF